MADQRPPTGVSFITQVLYCVVFLARYTDLFGRGQYVYNIIFKIFYILSSFYIIGLMQWVFPRTREKELAWKLGAACFFGALLLSPFTMLVFQGKDEWSMFYVSYSHSPDACSALFTDPSAPVTVALEPLLHPRVRLRPPAAPSPPPDHRAHRHR